MHLDARERPSLPAVVSPEEVEERLELFVGRRSGAALLDPIGPVPARRLEIGGRVDSVRLQPRKPPLGGSVRLGRGRDVQEEDRLVGPVDEAADWDAGVHHERGEIVVGEALDVPDALVQEAARS